VLTGVRQVSSRYAADLYARENEGILRTGQAVSVLM